MGLFDESQDIYNHFKGRSFSLDGLDCHRMCNGKPPYTQKERLTLISYLQRKYELKKSYKIVGKETVTFFSFGEMK